MQRSWIPGATASPRKRNRPDADRAFAKTFNKLELNLEAAGNRRDQIAAEVVADVDAGRMSVLIREHPGMAAGQHTEANRAGSNKKVDVVAATLDGTGMRRVRRSCDQRHGKAPRSEQRFQTQVVHGSPPPSKEKGRAMPGLSLRQIEDFTT